MAAVTGQRGRKIPLSVSELHTGHARARDHPAHRRQRVQTRRAGMAQAGCCFAGRQADSCVQPRGVPRLGEPEVEAKIKCAVSLLPASQSVDCKADKGVGDERLFRKGSRLRFFQAKESVRAGP